MATLVNAMITHSGLSAVRHGSDREQGMSIAGALKKIRENAGKASREVTKKQAELKKVREP